jgi:small subunit ribosomal protein S21
MAAQSNAVVVLREHEPIDSALLCLKKEMLKGGVFKELRRRDYYLKPSQRKRIKSQVARAKVRKYAKKRAAADLRFEDQKPRSDSYNLQRIR